MGTVITVMNMKGGIGKTTVALHLSGIYARYGDKKGKRRVLAIDYDPQFNLSQALLKPEAYFALEKAHKTSLAILFDHDQDLNPFEIQVSGNLKPPAVKSVTTRISQKSSGSYLDLVPSTLDMMYVALGHSAARTKPLEERFEKFIGACREEYDFVFIDCHPAGSIFTKTALQNSDHVLIPVAPQRYALRGIGLMLEFIAAKSLRGQPAMPHILFNLTPRDGVADEESQIRANPRYAGRCLNATLKEYKAFSEPADGSGFVWLSRKPWSTQAFRNLLTVASEFAGRIGMDFTL